MTNINYTFNDFKLSIEVTNSISSRKRQAFIDAVNTDARVNKFLHPGNSNDPAYHIEVRQGGMASPPPTSAPVSTPVPQPRDANATPTPGANATSTTPKAADSSVVQRLKTPAANTSSTWQNRLFAANLMGTDGDRRINFTLDRQANKITGSFSIQGTGHGNITKGSFDSNDQASPLNLECRSTASELVGQTRVLVFIRRGWDAKNNSSKATWPPSLSG